LHNQEHNDLNSQNITKVFQSRRVRLAGNVTRMGEKKKCIRGYGFGGKFWNKEIWFYVRGIY